jgi:hypothetical protein
MWGVGASGADMYRLLVLALHWHCVGLLVVRGAWCVAQLALVALVPISTPHSLANDRGLMCLT